MTETADTQVDRLVSLVAWMSQGDKGPVRYRDAARALGVNETVLREDLGLLVSLTEPYKEWLGSLGVALVNNGFYLSSRGPFRRPFRLSRDEALALILGLSGLKNGKALAARIGRTFTPDTAVDAVDNSWVLGTTPGPGVAQALAIIRQARDEQRKLELRYCGSDGEPGVRVVHPYQVIEAGRAWYLLAWCEQAGGARRFRADRILEVRELPETFERRAGLRDVRTFGDLLAAPEEPERVTVAFSPRIKRWIRERYPEGVEDDDGWYRVWLSVADPRWLAREVLQYGAEAEVLAPESMRQFMRGWIG